MLSTKRYDVAVIGAGPDGLAAAATLGRAGLSVIVLERAMKPGGRAITREFYPGFFASPFSDALAPIPPEIFRDLDLARRGAIPLPAAQDVTLQSAERARLQCLEHALTQAGRAAPRGLLARMVSPEPWPVPGFALARLAEAAPPEVLASTLEGRTTDPFLAGSAFHLLVPAPRFSTRGGLGALGKALTAAARSAGAEILCGLDVVELRRWQDQIGGVTLADGSMVDANAVISTLDLKRSFLGLFKWDALPKALLRSAGQFRMAGGTARLLLALRAPQKPLRAPLRLFSTASHFAAAEAAWRTGALARELPMTLRMVSALDGSLAPADGAVMTITVSGVPTRLADGAWTHEKRMRFTRRLIDAAETALAGLSTEIEASTLIVPSDMEEALGTSAGDLLGGEIAPDQMLGFRPWSGNSGARTPINGFYLAGPSSPAGVLGTCASGVVAARALLADRMGWR